MKVLFISRGNSKTGISPLIKNQGESLIVEGVVVSYFTIMGKGPKAYLKNITPLKLLLKENKFDIIHSHYGLSAIMGLFSKRKEKSIVSFMGDDLLGSNYKDGTTSYSSKVLAIINRLFSKWFYDYSIVKSMEMKSKILSRNVTLIPNGVDTEFFIPMDRLEALKLLEWDITKKHILFAANPYRLEKNFVLSKQALSLINNNEIELHSLVDLMHSQISVWMNASNVILLSSFHEGSPNVIKEAMACNRPIVSTDVGDVKWVIGETEGCYLTLFNPKDVADKIDLALTFSEEKEKTKGRERILELGLDSDTIAKRIIKVYNKVLNK